MRHCDDCGTKLINSLCPNCFEELYINDFQMSEDPVPVSKEWIETIDSQRQALLAHETAMKALGEE